MSELNAIHILFVAPLPPPIGGATLTTSKLINILKERSEVDLTIIDTARMNLSPIYSFIFALTILWQILDKGRTVDTITFHANSNARIYFGPVMYYVCRLLRKPLVIRVFGGTFDDQYLALSRIHKWILRKTLLSADCCLLETRRLVEFFEREGVKGATWFPNYTQPVGLTDETPYKQKCAKLAFLSRITRTKGVDVIMQAAPMMVEGIKIDLFGPLDAPYTAEYLNRICPDRVSYCGILTTDEIAAKLWTYDALVLPTFWYGEGYPAVILEAYAHGLPVITTQWQSIPEIVDSTSGLLVEVDNFRELARAINNLAGDEKLFHELQRGARIKANSFYIQYWAEQFVRFCNCALGRR